MARFQGKTPENSKLVKALSMYGVPTKHIAAQVGCQEKTLFKNFREELDEGMSMAYSKLTQTAYRIAVEDKNVTMLIFLMKTRLGFRETDREGGNNAEPKKIQIKPVVKDGRRSNSPDSEQSSS